jgi:DNA helicase-2/ATP-dependent DNA helicase PcrA
VDPRQICVLAKQKVAEYGQELIQELGQRGIKARDEGLYQDLLAEPAIVTALSFIELAVRGRAPEAWNHLIQVLFGSRGYGSDTPYDKTRKLEADLTAFIADLKSRLTNGVQSRDHLRIAMTEGIEYIGVAPFTQMFPQYLQGTYFNQVMTSAATLLWNAYQHSSDWTTALDTFRGVMTVPVMTVHKSKGLEYERVIFIGLESSAFWSFTSQPEADTHAFFVALSRAKRRLYFTFSRTRNTGRGGQLEQQSTAKIQPLYDLLKDAGVPVQN